jgi:Mg-chelatase subunit ChlD
VSRRELQQHAGFEDLSPDVGELDAAALEESAAADPDGVLSLLVQMTQATDPALARKALALAGSLFLDVARRAGPPAGGIGSLRSLPYEPDAGDLDVDASLDALTTRRAGVDPRDLRVRGWVRPETAWCLVVDRSGSMTGAPLATNAVAAAAVALRSPADYSVLAFAGDVTVVKAQLAIAEPVTVVDAVLGLRGAGTTDVAAALRAAAIQLAGSRAARRITVLLSDCRANVPGDAIAAAALVDELLVIAPAGDSADAESFAAATGARLATIAGPSELPAALATID